jgi:lipoprotein-anchoring transpeptidase ErfK/SrfK
MIRVKYCILSIAAALMMLANPAAAQNAPVTPVVPEQSAETSPVPAPTIPPIAEPAPPPTAAAPIVDPTPAAPVKPVRKGPVDSLKPGQFVWEKRDSYENPLRMVVVLDIQRLYVFDGDKLVGFSTMSSGKAGKETPSGIFKILQKKIYHESNIYANAPMPFMQRLTWDGIAIHAGHLPGYPASHGCIRLPKRFAEALYGVTQMDGEVVILESLSKPLARPKPATVEPAANPPATVPGQVPQPATGQGELQPQPQPQPQPKPQPSAGVPPSPTPNRR